jgi:hypothetical protein
MLFRSPLRQVECEFEYAVDALAGKQLSWTTISRSVPSNILPPTDEYSPSVFSRTT